MKAISTTADVSRSLPLRQEAEKSVLNCQIPNIIILLLGRIWWQEIILCLPYKPKILHYSKLPLRKSIH